MLSRRSLLILFGATTTTGCLNRLPSVGNAGFRLGPLWVTNSSDEPQKLSLLLKRDNTTIFEDILELGTDPGENIIRLEPTWTAEPANYSLSFGSPEGKQQTYELTADDNEAKQGDCMFVHIDINYPLSSVPTHAISPASEHSWDPSCP